MSNCIKKKAVRYHPIYSVWHSMVRRTTVEKDQAFKNYGGRGISVCDRWVNSFENFVEDMYPSYKKGLSIDRINNNGNYEPCNCRWSIRSVQVRNTRKIYSDNTSGYRGVYFNKQRCTWYVMIGVNSKRIFLGTHESALECAKAYDTYVIQNNLEHTINGVLHELLN